ncbi:WD40/YVTN/BNR-like repeat-containing protein [Fundidesulfovibrio soli]|uniref:WD40/YVTN/BNR-like repeat-containing protein n=1 Tax=Fundidesulfovibrio soli TaxID=2922716 RepID=UPI001FAFAD9F|nr:hypothetical protein [Fundidesulfovibrio soli]
MFTRPAFLALIVSLLALAPAFARADAPWKLLNYAPTANTLLSVYTPDAGSTVYFAGDGGVIVKKSGTAFTLMDTGTMAPLRGISGSGPADIWAVGGSSFTESTTDAERSVLLHYNGQTWTRTTPPSLQGLAQNYVVNGVWVSPTGSAFAVVEYYNAPARFDAGQNRWDFEALTIDYQAHPNARSDFSCSSIFGFSDTDVYAVGSYGTVLHRDASGWKLMAQFETDGGSGGTFTFNLLESVWGPGAGTVFASGNFGQMYMLDNTAQTPAWSMVNQGGGLFNGYDLAAMSGTGPNDVWLAGLGGTLRHWTGAVNQLGNFDTVPLSGRHAITRLTGNSYLLAGDLGLIESFNGATAARTALSSKTTAGNNLSWGGAGLGSRLWLAPMYISQATGIYSWSRGKLQSHPVAGLNDSFLRAFKVFASNDIWLSAVAFSDGANYLKRFNGSTWSDWQPPGFFGQAQAINGVAKAAGGYAVLLSSNNLGQPCFAGAASTTCLDQFDPNSYTYSDIAAGPDGSVYAVGQEGRLAIWRNGTWTTSIVGAQGLSPKDGLTAVAAGPGMVVALGENQAAFYSTDGGSNWQPVAGITRRPPQEAGPLAFFRSVVHAGNGVFWAALITNGGYTDGGKSYLYRIQNGVAELVQGGFSSMVYNLSSAPEQQALFGVGENGVIWTTNPNFREPGLSRGLPGALMLLVNQ